MHLTIACNFEGAVSRGRSRRRFDLRDTLQARSRTLLSGSALALALKNL